MLHDQRLLEPCSIQQGKKRNYLERKKNKNKIKQKSNQNVKLAHPEGPGSPKTSKEPQEPRLVFWHGAKHDQIRPATL